MIRNKTGQALCQLLRSSRADVPDETTSILDTMAALAKHGKTSLRVECQYATYNDCLADGCLNLMASSDIIQIILNLLRGSDNPVKTSGLAVIKYRHPCRKNVLSLGMSLKVKYIILGCSLQDT